MILGFDNRKVTNVSEWLEIATEGIAVPGKQRIAREITAHYADAVQALREKGESEESARARALGDLGKPQDAAKKFRKEYLTELDALFIERLYKAAIKPIRSAHYAADLSIVSVALFFQAFHPSWHPAPDPNAQRQWLPVAATIWALWAVVFPMIAYAVASGSSQEVAKKRLFYVQFFKFFVTTPLLYLCVGSTCFQLMFGMWVLCFWWLEHVWSKVRRSKKIDGETPLST